MLSYFQTKLPISNLPVPEAPHHIYLSQPIPILQLDRIEDDERIWSLLNMQNLKCLRDIAVLVVCYRVKLLCPLL